MLLWFLSLFLGKADVPTTSYGYLELTHDEQTNDIFRERENVYEVIANNKSIDSDEPQYQSMKTESEIVNAFCRNLEINISSEVDTQVLNQAEENVENKVEYDNTIAKDYEEHACDVSSPQVDFAEKIKSVETNKSSEVESNQLEAEEKLEALVEHEDALVNGVAHPSNVESFVDNFTDETRNSGTNASSEVDQLISNQSKVEMNLESRVEYEDTLVNVVTHTNEVGSPQEDYTEENRSFETNTSFEVDHLVSNQLKAEHNLDSQIEYEDTIVDLVAQTSDIGSLPSDFAEETRNLKTNHLSEVDQLVLNQLKTEKNAESQEEYEDTIVNLVAHTSNVESSQNDSAKKDDDLKTNEKEYKKNATLSNNTVTAYTVGTADEINTENHKEDNEYSHQPIGKNSDELKENSYEIAYSDFMHLPLSKKYSQNKHDYETAKYAEFARNNNEPLIERSSMNENSYEIAYADIKKEKNVEPPTINIDNAA